MNYYAEISAFYDDITERYFNYDSAVKIVKKFLSSGSVLDIGCGTGNLSFRLAAKGYNVTGVDISKALLAIAREKNTGRRVDFIEQDMRHLDLGKKFDMIIIYEAVFCIFRHGNGYEVEVYFGDDNGMRKAIKNAYEHLNSNGFLIVDIRDERDNAMRLQLNDGYVYSVETKRKGRFFLASHFIEKEGEIIAKSDIHKSRIPFTDFKKLLQDAGFVIDGFDQDRKFFIARKSTDGFEGKCYKDFQ